MIQRLPDILISPTSIDSIDKVMDFLSSLGLSSSETREVAVRVPQVLTYSVTQHLIPHRAVLLSLLPEAQAEDHLRDLVNSSPQVLSPSIDAVILHFTRRRVPRRHIGRLLKHSTVIEYLIPTLPLRATAFDALSSILFADSKPRDEPDVYPL